MVSQEVHKACAPLSIPAIGGVMVGDAAHRTGLTARAIRLYEDRGLVQPARDAVGRRLYNTELVARLEVIALGRTAGLPIEDIGELLHIGDLEGREQRRLRMIELCEQRQQDLIQQGRRIVGVLRRLRSADPCPSQRGA